MPRLGAHEAHWKKGRSAYELSTAWMKSSGPPPAVRHVLQQAPEWLGADFLDGIFERETALPGKGQGSQTDLLALFALADGTAILGVEGKVDESFDKPVSEWLSKAKNENRSDRIVGLCSTLEVDASLVGELYYQLLHRTCAAIYEAQRWKCKHAMMLVHSFGHITNENVDPPRFSDFRLFSEVVGMPVLRPGTISPIKVCSGIQTRLAWVTDNVSE